MQAKPFMPSVTSPRAERTSAQNLYGLAVERQTRAEPSAGVASSTCFATAVCGSMRTPSSPQVERIVSRVSASSARPQENTERISSMTRSGTV